MKNQFGYCLRESHPSFGSTGENHVCKIITHIDGRIMKDDVLVVDKNVDKILESFLDIESLGTSCNPKCGNCQCKNCPIGMNSYTIKEGRGLS